MRYHVLGVGSIGSLIAFHLKRSVKLQRQLLQPGPSSSKSRRELLLSNLSNKAPPQRQGTIVSSLSHPPYIQSELPDPLQTLIITTKCDTTLSALESIRHRIHPWSTIVLLQNGMGVLDTLFDTFFKDPESRPNFILASTTHGCWRKGPLDIMHASPGALHFGIVPSGRAGSEGFEAEKVPFGHTIATVKGGLLPTIGSAASKKARGWERFAPDADADPQKELDPNSLSSKLSIGSIPDQPNLRTLRATVAGLLSLPLNVEWEPIREFQLRALRKVVINACINPLTALADCKNGDLFGNPAAMDAMWSVCLEAGMVLEAQVREHLSSSSDASKRKSTAGLSTEDLLILSTETGEPMLHPSLTPQALFQEAQRVARMTAANWSSMHADLKKRRGSTEIDYINGYISALGRGYNIDTTANDLLTNMIKLKTSKVTGSGRF
uniref:2-dehydropantoate 2-reductase n=1 Tax=Kalmanozyma brasiliensis (strain GHG001) TaxID=1365824 RepID=V5GL41_KALBG